MAVGQYSWALALVMLSASAVQQAVAPNKKPEESTHRRGPGGLEGWTIDYPFPDRPEERYPRILVLSHNGKVIRRITGQNYIWNWIFWSGGRQVAYEDGPPHFIMKCVLADVATGREQANYDCFREVASNAPPWVKALEMSVRGK